MNRIRSGNFSCRFSTQRPLVAACAAGLLALGLATSAWAITGGQGGAATEGSGFGGNSHSGGSGGVGGGAQDGHPGSIGVGGAGGAGTGLGDGSGGGAGGHGGQVASVITTNSTINANTFGGQGAYGHDYSRASEFDGGGGGGGGGDAVYVGSSATVTINASVLVTAGNGGPGGYGYFYIGGGGGGGNGVEFGNGGTLINYGAVSGGSGGSGIYSNHGGGGGGGGGNGVTGSNITIANHSAIIAGASGNAINGGSPGSNGDAILFTDGNANNLSLYTGSTITSDIELAASAYVDIAAKDGALIVPNRIVLGSNSSRAMLDARTQSFTISGVISGSGNVVVYGSDTNFITLNASNTFTGGTTIESGALDVSGDIGDVSASGGILGGDGTVGNITLGTDGSIAPGDGVGTLHGTSLMWDGAGSFDFQLGESNSTSDSDLLALSAALTKGVAGTYVFHFTDGNGAPQLGVTYTLATFASSSGFSASDFSFDYTGANPILSGTFRLQPTSLTFTPGGIIFADGFEGP